MCISELHGTDLRGVPYILEVVYDFPISKDNPLFTVYAPASSVLLT